MWNIGICDDGVNTCSDIETMILDFSERSREKVCVEIWYTGEALCEYLTKGNNLDILFLDIELWKMSGIQVGNFIRNQLEDRGMQIIYISGKQSYAPQLFKTQPMDFLVKPITQIQIDEIFQLAEKMPARGRQKFEFQVGKEYYYVPLSDIFYFNSDGKKITLKTRREKWVFYGKLKEILEKLPENFMLIHQSFIINRAHVFLYAYEMVEMEDGTKINISKANRKKIRQKILEKG
ncbi:MAG: response regulator transcription factor [Lachnospiraceae bacterium]|nr:response regulator transcription factor [Lachnospiraceae bacterium]